MRLLRSLPFVAALVGITSKVQADDSKVIVSKTGFQTLPTEYFYFEDSPCILSYDRVRGVVWRSDDSGATWKEVSEGKGRTWDLYQHPFDNTKAYILTDSTDHFKTEDRGKSWEKWNSKELPSNDQSPLSAMNFHSGKGKSDYIILLAKVCEDGIDLGFGDCQQLALYTKDNFKTEPKRLMDDTHGCLFAHSSKQFDKATDDTVLCIHQGKSSYKTEKRRLYVSEDFFESGLDKAVEPKLDGQRAYQGISGVAVVQKFLIVAVKSEGTTEMALFVSNNAKDWSRAEFPAEHGKVEEDAYTILESLPSSLQVDVLTTKATNAIGSLFSSDSTGTQFVRILPDTNRNKYGLVDMESISNIEGIIIANVVANADELRRRGSGIKKIVSKISFDNGRTWSDIKADGKIIHLHSVSDLANLGRVFSSPAPGMVMGIGNTGDSLKDYTEGDLYVSDDAGLSWKLALEGAHKYEFGDQGSIFVAVYDEEITDRIMYSLDHGAPGSWKIADLGVKIHPKLLTTTPDSTSTKFTLVASAADRADENKYYIFCLDFSKVRGRDCKKDDFEKWYARLDEKGEPDCLLGHKQYFLRRKKDSDCFVGDEYKEQEPKYEVCPCTKEDYECDINFARKDGDIKNECIPKSPKFDDKGSCKTQSSTFKGPSGYRIIPGDNCDKEKGEKLDGEVDRPCGDIKELPPSDGKVTHKSKTFAGEMYFEQFYIERSDTSTGDDETVLIRTKTGELWISRDHGFSWDQPSELKKEEIVAVYPNPYSHDRVYFLTASELVIFTHDRGKTFKTFKAPGPPNGLDYEVINFHPMHPDYLIWTTHKDCPGPDCHAVAHYTIDENQGWQPLLGYVRNCKWIANNDMDRKNVDKNMIFCERWVDDDPKKGKLELVTSDSFFKQEKVVFQGIKGFATMEEFINVAVVDDARSTLKVVASMDGKTFAPANFPRGFEVPHQHAYTVLESKTHAVFLHVTVQSKRGSEYGAILKSNSNGTDYIMSLPNVNRDEAGYVDFERMQGLLGVSIANIVSNPKEVDSGASKKYKTKITHNDGGLWSLIPAPPKDSENHGYSCDIHDILECSLNLHGYTERNDKRHTYSSATAIGLMMAVGNVGPELTALKDGDTFLTRDGGITWSEVHKGAYMWEYGDQGALIVIVKQDEPTKSVLYSRNEGKTWEEYFFTDTKVNVFDISSVPSDTSRKFIVWVREPNSSKFSAVALDFTGLTNRKCEFKSDDTDNDDFEFWRSRHPDNEGDDCIFGMIREYNRKIPDKDCYIGDRLVQPHMESRNCTCTKRDYECDYNYITQTDGSCSLAPGHEPIDHKQQCFDNPNLMEWYEPTGFRRVPLTECSGGQELDKTAKSHPCPGKEGLWKEKHGGIGAVGIFFLTVLSFGMAGVLGYVLWNRWPGKLGAIRLGDAPREESPFIKYPVIVLSAIVAVVAAIPSIVGALVRIVSSKFQRRPRYTTRGSFARGAYDEVTNDEGELLGEDSDEEV